MRTIGHQVSFAEIEFKSQGISLDPLMQAISKFFDENYELVEMVRRDIDRGLKTPNTGRKGMNAQQVLRSLTLMRIKNWDYRELRERIADGYSLRLFTQFGSEIVPKHDAFNRSFNRITPQTLRAINDAVVQAAVKMGLEDARKLRVDTTVVETNIHYPTDCTLLWDSVRVITRWVGRLKKELPSLDLDFPDRTLRARRRMQEISRMTLKARKRQHVRKYRDLIELTEEVVGKARMVIERARHIRVPDVVQGLVIDGMVKEIERMCVLADRVIDQARRRVLKGEQVPNEEKIYSIFEPHTDLIKRGKANKPVEFGHKVFLAESANGLITQYRVLDGNPSDREHVIASLKNHKEMFGVGLDLYAGDRGFDSEDNLRACKEARVAIVCIPQRGGKKTEEREGYEKSRAFKSGQRFRAGIEGRISVLFRGRGMKRCLLEGHQRFEVFVGAAVLANNLMAIAALLARRAARLRPAA